MGEGSECLKFTPFKDGDELCSGRFCVERRGSAGYVSHSAFINGHPAGFLCNTCVKFWKLTWEGCFESSGSE